MMNIEIRGMSFFRNDDGTHPYRTLALAEVYLPDLAMTIRDVRLTWSKERGFVTHAPSSKAVARPTIQWFHRSEFAQQLSQQLRDMFERMGGELPGDITPREFRRSAAARRVSEKRRDHVTGKIIGLDQFDDGKEATAEELEAARVLG